MKKIDKTIKFSTVYEKWISSAKIPHPKSSKFYLDVVMELMRCQNGLCAYTEVKLCNNQEWYSENSWLEGRTVLETKLCDGQLEHFDSSLKDNEHWKWENLFMVQSDTNNRKNNNQIDYILKPDSPDYNEFELLEYNSQTHMFCPLQSKSIEDQVRIKKMLDILGINHPNLVSKRKIVVEKAVEYDPPSVEVEFPTAFAMYKKDQSGGLFEIDFT